MKLLFLVNLALLLLVVELTAAATAANNDGLLASDDNSATDINTKDGLDTDNNTNITNGNAESINGEVYIDKSLINIDDAGNNDDADNTTRGNEDDGENLDGSQISANTLGELSPFLNNLIRSMSGSLYCDTSKSVMSDCTIYRRSGASTLYINRNSAMNRVLIICMTSSTCIYLYGGRSLKINSADITGNNKGRFIQLASGAALELGDVTGHGFGTYSHNGGFIYASSNYNVKISNSTIKNNQGQYGAALYLNGYGKFTSYSTKFEYNYAKYSGGAIYAGGNGNRNATTWNIHKSTFKGNRVTNSNYGGAIYAYRVRATVIDTEFSSNYAYHYGGALFLQTSTFTFHCSLFASNTVSKTHGGAIFAQSSTYITLIKTMFLANGNKNDLYCSSTYVYRDLYTTALLTPHTTCYYRPIAPTSRQNIECTKKDPFLPPPGRKLNAHS